MDPLIIFIVMLIMPAFAYINITTTNAKYQKVDLKKPQSGFEVAKEILEKNNLDEIYIVEVPHSLYNSYDPNRKTIKLRTEVFHGETITAASIAAHECVHAIQDKEKNKWMRIRSLLLPAILFINKIAYITLLGGVILGTNDLILLSVAIIGVCLIYHVLTLAVEYDASSRAKELLIECKLVNRNESEECDKVLSSTSLTYVSTVLTSIFQLINDLINFKK